MSTLQFPSNPVNGELYPPNPPQGDVQYQYDAAAGTWRILGAATGVIPGTYGSISDIPQFTVDASGKLTFAQNIPTSGLIGTLQTVTDNGSTTTNPMQVNLTSSGATGFTVVNSNAITDRVEIHPTFVAVRNGYLEIQENSLPSITVDALGVPYIRIRRDGYLSLGTGSTVFTEKIRLLGSDGSASFDGSVVVNSLTANGDIRVFDGLSQVAQIAPASSFFDQLAIAGLNYPTADAPAGYIMTTDGLGNLTLQPAPAVVASTLQGVTDNGNTTTNPILFLDGSNNTVISINPVTGRITALPQGIAGGTTLDAAGITFGNSSGSIISSGTDPSSLNFRGLLGVDLTTNSPTTPISLRPGGTTLFSVTGASTNIDNALIASGLSYPTSDGTNGQVLYTDGSGNLGWTSVVTTISNLQNVTNAGNTTTNSIIIDGTANPAFPLIITATSAELGIQIKGDAGAGNSYIEFADNAGTTPYGVIASGPSYLAFGVGSTTPLINITTAGTTMSTPVTMTGGLEISGNISSIYQLRTQGLGGIVVGSSGVDRASIQGATGDILTQGSLTVSGITYPTADGNTGQVISTNGNGVLGWSSVTTPNLQQVTNVGSTTTNEVTLGSLVASGLRYPTFDGLAGQVITTNGSGLLSWGSGATPSLQEVTNVGSTTTSIITTAGLIAASLNYPLNDGTPGQALTTDGAGNLSFTSPAAPSLQAVTDTGSITTNGITVGSIIAAGLVYPTVDGLNNQSLYTNGVGTLYWGEPYGDLEQVVTNGNITTLPISVAGLRAGGITYPSTDGAVGETLVTDGFGTLTWAPNYVGLQITTDIGATTTNPITVTGTGSQVAILSGAGLDATNGALKVTAQAGAVDVYGGTGLRLYNSFVSPALTLSLESTTGRATVGPLVASGLSYPTADGTNGQVITTNGAGVLSFQDRPTSTLQTVTDAGNTTTNNMIVNANITSNSLNVAGISYPTIDGLSGYALVTNGFGTLSWAPNVSTLQQVTNAGNTTTNSITVGGLTSASLTYPTTDGAANEVISTNGAGILSWLAVTRFVSAVPATSASPGALGDIAMDGGFLYFHDGTQWERLNGQAF